MKETYLQNIKLSSEIIVFDQETREGELAITNKHNTLGVVFKIKATKLNIIDVKPAKGFIKPQAKVVINFKISANLTPQQMETIENNDKFLIQFLNIQSHEASREEVQSFWKAYKNNTANLQHGYGCYRVFMNLTGKRLAIFNVKSQNNSKMYKTAMKTSNALSNDDFQKKSEQKTQANDLQLSKKYTQLKQKEQDLQSRRQNIFKAPTKDGKSKSSNAKSLIVLLILFLIAFTAGNYARSRMVKVKSEQKIKQQKKWYAHVPFFNN